MTAAPARSDGRIDHYDWAGGREAMLRFGPDGGPVVVVSPPLFEEANRTRATIVAMLCALADRRIGGALPDLPGQHESLVHTRDARLTDWRAAFAAAAAALPGAACIASFRGGALLDTEAEATGRWHLSPASGSAQVRELRRQRAMAEGKTALFAGNDLSSLLIGELETAEPSIKGRLRVVRLAGDPRPADATLPFAPPWRTAEPRRDDALAAALADDIARWMASCVD